MSNENSFTGVMVAVFYVYIIIGILLVIFDGIMTLTILRSVILRKRYALICAQVINDVFMGFGLFSAGIGRVLVLYSGSKELKSSKFCMLMPWNLFFIWCEPLTAMFYLAISMDRLFAMLFPISYFKHLTRFQFVQISCSYGIIGIIVLLNWCVASSDVIKNKEPVCWTRDGMAEFYRPFSLLFTIVPSILSIFIYVAVYMISRKFVGRVRANQIGREAAIAFEERQVRLALTTGISNAFTVILYVLPLTLKYFLQDAVKPNIFGIVIMYAAVSSTTNPLVNVAAIVIRQDDIRSRMFSMLRIGSKGRMVQSGPWSSKC